ncbi:YcaO-like family protein [Sediminibacillus sp. JSM 1682029]|uniref:YcaO-like family protein n=1 Tax=Sediminibacillus sp. JSM 1682029 TaxID=3229857 RepID=UPI0035232289
MKERNSLIETIRNQKSSILYYSPSIGYIHCFITYAGNKARTFNPLTSTKIFVYIYVDYNKVTLGPVFQQGQVGCPKCFEERRKLNRRYYHINDEESITIINDVDLLPLDVIPELLDNLCRRYAQSSSLDYYVIEENRNTRLLTYWPLHPCEHCLIDGEESYRDVDKIKEALSENLYYPNGSAYRLDYNGEDLDRVFDYRNTDSGFFLFQDFDGETLFSVSSYFPINHSDSLIAGTGTGNNLRDSVRTSIFEGLERYAGMQPRGRGQERILNSFEALRKQKKTIDPTVFLENVIGKNTDIEQYSPYKKIFWVPAFSVKDKTTVYLPESLAYYKYSPGDEGHANKIYKGNSNGNAVGSHLLDAIYYSCLELMERDAFLNHWYLQHTPKRIDISSINDVEINRMVKQLLTMQYDVAIFDITMELEIPIVWVFCKGKSSEKIATYSTAGAHHNPLKAITSALVEMVHAIEYYDANSKMIKESAFSIKEKGVQELTDHPILYSLETERYLFDFLDGDQKGYSLTELYSMNQPNSNDLINFSQIVQDLLNHLSKQFGDVYIVRQTPKGYEQLQLEIVKVLIPNIQQLWFGEENREISEVRINQVREFWGYSTEAELNKAPHPFP